MPLFERPFVFVLDTSTGDSSVHTCMFTACEAYRDSNPDDLLAWWIRPGKSDSDLLRSEFKWRESRSDHEAQERSMLNGGITI